MHAFRSDSPCSERLRRALPLVILTAVVLIWSSNNIVTKLALREMTPALLTLIRFTVTTLVFHLPMFLAIRRLGQPFSRGEWLRLGIAAVLGYAGSTLLFTTGVSRTPATYAALMLMTGPIWTAVLERVFVGTRIRLIQGAGMTLAFLGAAILATGGSLEGGGESLLLGSLLLIGAQATWGGYTILTKPLLARRSPLTVVAGANLIGTPFIWPATGLLGAWEDIATIPTWSAGTWIALLYLTLIASALSQILYAYGLRDVSPSQAMAFTYLMPVFTAFFAGLALDERPTVLTFVCGAVIVLGLVLLNSRRSSLDAREPARVAPASTALAPRPAPEA